MTRLVDLFTASVARHADAPAVDVPPGAGRAERVVVTYAQLATMAAQVAAALAPHVRAEALVLVLLDRTSPWLYAAQLGAMQAGAGYVAVDPTFPDQHLAHVAADAKVAAVLTDAAGAARVASLGLPVVALPLSGSAPDALPPPPAWADDRSLAYAIYTSGTTGKPKGVLIEHRGAVNLVTQGVRRFSVRPGDRCAQGSSPAYDSSVEETWLAFAAGATVVPLDDETVRMGPDLVAWLRRERITVFCPPPTLLRAMDVRSPRAELPDLRLCYVGGEALAADLADLWGGEVWMENGYGPTECTVTVARGRVLPGRPVTIGRPVPPHVAWILGDDGQPVRDGEAGELCIAGPGLARGYLGLPELTEQRFPTLPGIGRVYRTGDLVSRDGDGEISFHGRIDTQVKVRGYRIELEAIEAVLAGCKGVREVACCAQDEDGEKVLAAHVVPAPAGATPERDAMAAAVRAVLPDYMTPKRFALATALPRTISGKIDRKRLPAIAPPAGSAVGASWKPATASERLLRDEFAATLRVEPASIGPDSDFFALGGDSLRAAVLVSRLRRQPGGEATAVRDVYLHRTPAALAARVQTAADAGAGAATAFAAAATAAPPPLPTPWLATFVQTFVVGAIAAAAAGLAWLAGFVVLPWLAGEFTLLQLLFVGPWLGALAYAAYAVVTLALAIGSKELLIGRYLPQRAPAWSSFHVRHWIVVRLVRLVPWSLLDGTEAKVVALRALGARIGQRVHLHRGVDVLSGGWDLIEIGDDATLQREAGIGACQLDDGHLVVGTVRIGAGATLATRAGVGPDTVVGAGSVLGALAYVPPGGVVPPGELWQGTPAQRVGPAPGPQPIDVPSRPLPPWPYTLLRLCSRLFWAPLVALPFTGLVYAGALLLGVDEAALVAWLCGDGPSSRPELVWLAVLLALAGAPIGLVAQALALRWSPPIPVGTHGRWTWLHLQAQVRMDAVEAAGQWLAGAMFWPMWLRLAGMRIGRDAEISTIVDVLPEHAVVGAGAFLADGIYLGVPRMHGGAVTVAPTALGERCFVGNHVVMDAGQRLPDDVVLGVCTVADDRRMAAGTGWFGQPAFALPRREVVAADRRLTHRPSALRVVNRLFWESARFALPALPVWLGLVWFDVVAAAGDDALAQSGFACAATVGYALALAAVVIAAKWLLLGKVKPSQHALWSCWANRWDFHYVVWERYGRGFLQLLEGTLLLPWFLRALGMKIGRRVLLGDGFAQVVDPDMLRVDDGATVHAMFQAHSFEDRVLKTDRVRVRAHATVGRGAVVLYGADIGDGAHVMAHSVVMKQETLLPRRGYAGAPTVEIARRHEALRAAPAAAPMPEARVDAFDAARGLAVLGMVWLHFVPEAAEDAGALARRLGWTTVAGTGVPSTLFFLLAGVAWACAARRDGAESLALRPAWVARRSLALAAVGVPFWIWAWPNDVLTAFALALPCVALLQRWGRTALASALVLLLLAIPCAARAFGGCVAGDLLADSTHLANHGFGWETLRWFLYDGSYPLLPWLWPPLLGALLAMNGRTDAARWKRWIALGAVMTAIGLAADGLAARAGDLLGDVAGDFAVTWQPTSIPFLLRNGGVAVLLVGLMAWRGMTRGLPGWLRPVAAVGRMSLSHYLGHVLLVFAPLRLWWPDEDWGMAVGVAAALGYALFALAASVWWFRGRARGPLEAWLGRISGPSR
jgi:non-ribosomal peptide synthetase-like protein